MAIRYGDDRRGACRRGCDAAATVLLIGRRCGCRGASDRQVALSRRRLRGQVLAELEPRPVDLQAFHPHPIANLLRRGPRPQLRPLSFAHFGAGRQHMRPAVDDDTPPSGEFGVVVVGLESHERVRRCAEELGALGGSEQHLRASGDEGDREESAPPVETGDDRPTTAGRRLRRSSSPSTVTVGPAMDMERHYGLDVSPVPRSP